MSPTLWVLLGMVVGWMQALVVHDIVTMRRGPRRRWQIQCPARCGLREVDPCPDHVGQTWRKSQNLPYGASIVTAYRELRKHRKLYPRSGPYRLRKV